MRHPHRAFGHDDSLPDMRCVASVVLGAPDRVGGIAEGNAMSIDNLLSRLDRVRKTGAAQWVARCPAHDDRSPSLSIAETADGRVLLHDFGGCSALAVLEAVGLDFAGLFPERIPDDSDRRKSKLAPRTALTAIAADATEAAVIVSDVAEGRTEAEAVRLHLWTLAGRIASALSLAGCAHG